MPRFVKMGVATLGGVAVGGAAVAAVAARRWERATTRVLARLRAAERRDTEGSAVRFALEQLDGLPAPVARYLAFALAPGQRRVRRARIRWAGEFAIRPGAWRPFTALQHYTVRPPGFVWDADIRTMPLLPTRVRDGYVRGTGTMLGAVGGVVPVVDQRDTPQLTAGALMRWLGEAVWLPTALLPGDGVSWTPVSDRSARASLTDGTTTVSMDFHFGAGGEILRVSALRHRDVDGTPVLTPWAARLAEYVRVGGMMIPGFGEVEWVTPEGRWPYWRGRPVTVQYDYAGVEVQEAVDGSR